MSTDTSTFNTDSSLELDLTLNFWAPNDAEADATAKAMGHRMLGDSLFNLCKLGSITKTSLVAQAITGANYIYPYQLRYYMGNSGAPSPQYIPINDVDAAAVKDELIVNAQRVSQLNEMVPKINYLNP